MIDRVALVRPRGSPLSCRGCDETSIAHPSALAPPCNVMGEVLLSRYDLFINHKVKTHITTNLNAQELEDRYGNRVRSRMREMMNLLAFDSSTIDKRI